MKEKLELKGKVKIKLEKFNASTGELVEVVEVEESIESIVKGDDNAADRSSLDRDS